MELPNTIVFLFLLGSILLVIILSCITQPTQREFYSPYGYTVKYGNPNTVKPWIEDVQPPFPAGSFEDVDTQCKNGTCTHAFHPARPGVKITEQNPFRF